MKCLCNAYSDAKCKEEKDNSGFFFCHLFDIVVNFKSYPVFLGTFFLAEVCVLQSQY